MRIIKKILFKVLSNENYLRLHHFYFLYRLKKSLGHQIKNRQQNFLEEELIFAAEFIREGDIFLDIGGYLGAWAVYLGLRVGNSGSVHTFEPVNFAMLGKTLEHFYDLPVQSHKIALSDTSGEIKMKTPVHQGIPLFSTTHSESSLTHHKEFIVNTAEKSTLDAFLNSHNIDMKKVQLLKIDVEGSEMPLLKGAEKFLSENSPLVICEIWFDKNKNSIHKIFTDMHFRAYKLSGPGTLADVTDLADFEKASADQTHGNLIFCKKDSRSFDKLSGFVR